MLLLTEEGARLVRADQFNTREPDVNLLVRPGERPFAIYYWAIVAEPQIPAGPMIIIAMGDLYADVPLYVRPTTEAGLKRVQRSNYKPLTPGRDGMGDLFSMARYPGFDEFRKKLSEHDVASRSQRPRPRIEVKVVSAPSEMEMAMRIRAVYLIEQRCPYFEEYDGNDYCGTTFLGFVGAEPAGTLRVRYFADFVKFERMTVLPRFRTTTTVSRDIVERQSHSARERDIVKVTVIRRFTRSNFGTGLGSGRFLIIADLSSPIISMSKSKANLRRMTSDHDAWRSLSYIAARGPLG